jgi:hypothetical protein
MNKSKHYLTLLTLGSTFTLAAGCVQASQEVQTNNNNQNTTMKEVVINSVSLKVSEQYDFFTWDNLPSDVSYQKMPLQTFTNTNGETHYYEVVYVSSGNLNWYQAAYLAADAGGYLASITSDEENFFLFNQTNDEKYYFKFPTYKEGSNRMNHHGIMIGPMLGGYQLYDVKKPDSDWHWLSGEKWSYTNWAQNLDDGVIDSDPRNNTQPNDSGKDKNQRILGFGELNQPVPTWGDYSDDAGTYGARRVTQRYSFIIEYEKKPS